jgi:hypothetical protein
VYLVSLGRSLPGIDLMRVKNWSHWPSACFNCGIAVFGKSTKILTSWCGAWPIFEIVGRARDELLAGLIAQPPNTQKEKAMQRERHKASTRSLPRSANSKESVLAGGISRPQVHPNHILEQSIAAQNTLRFDYLEVSVRSTFRRSARFNVAAFRPDSTSLPLNSTVVD